MKRCAFTFFTLLALSTMASAQSYPVKPIRLIAPSVSTTIGWPRAGARLLATQRARISEGLAGRDVVGDSPAQFAAVIRTELTRWGPIIREAGIKAE